MKDLKQVLAEANGLYCNTNSLVFTYIVLNY